MIDFLIGVALETASVLYEGSLFILLGFLVAGLLHEFLPTDTIARHLGRNDARSVTLAALFGAPIPLCSCGVLPAAAALRDKGASRASTLSFTISTPETGVDSIALSYGLLGPIMAVVRPLVAIVTGVVAGLLSMRLAPESEAPPPGSVADDCPVHGHAAEPCAEHADDTGAAPDPAAGSGGWRPRGRRVLAYGFDTLLDEIAFWIVAGVLLTGVLSALLPDDFFGAVLGWDRGLLPMLAMVAVGVPLYLCASASTPVAAALVTKGLSPGAALVFLLVGPATNAASIGVVGRLLGERSLRIYLGSVLGVAIAAGLVLDAVAADAVRRQVVSGGLATDPTFLAGLKILGALGFSALLVRSFWRTRFREGLRDAGGQLARIGAGLAHFQLRWLVRLPVLLGGLLVAVLAIGPDSVLVVGPGERGVVQRLGRVVAGDLEPGLHWHWPPPLGRGQAVEVERVRSVEVGFETDRAGRRQVLGAEAYYLTADENIVDLRAVVHYRVSDAARFALGSERSDARIRSLARRELLEVSRRTGIDSIYTTARADTEDAFRRGLRARVAEAGIGCEVLDARLLDVHAPGSVHDAFRDVASALEDRERSVHDASGYAAERRATARGEAAGIVQQGHAEARRQAALALGSTAPFSGLAAVHQEHPRVTETRLRLESLERSLAEPIKYIHLAGGKDGEVDLWIGSGSPPAPTMRGGRARAAQPTSPGLGRSPRPPGLPEIP